MDTDRLLRKYDRRLPRYTSYPTAPHFSPAVGATEYARWLGALGPDEPISLYLHVPFCEQLCLFCGCHTSVARQAGPREAYTKLLLQEIALVAAALPHRARVAHIHWGGGTPTALPADCLREVSAALERHFTIEGDAEIAVELDPRHLPADRLAALRAMGVTRASLGVQDLEPAVQQAIGRVQPFAQVADCAAALRDVGIDSLNLDLIYGLPRQTVVSVTRTAERVLALAPDRIAVFGYAHVPWMKKHQTLLPEVELPDAAARFAQRAAIDTVLQDAGYVAIGLDHYARPDDALAEAAQAGTMRRNFQGYTTDTAAALIGLGASAIGSLPQGYAQNAARIPDYAAALAEGRLPVVRGLALTEEDKARRGIIEAIMCGRAVTLDAIRPSGPLDALVEDGLVRWDGQHLQPTPDGRPFVRHLAALFDAYLQPETLARHAAAL